MKTITNRKHSSSLHPNELEELKFEYDNLRKEILHNEVVGMQLMAFALVIVVGGMGFVIKSNESALIKIVALSGIIGFLTLVVLQNLDKIRMTFLIASYLRYFVEPKARNIKWETRLNKFRKVYEKDMGKSRYNSVLLTYLTIAFSNLLLMVAYTVKYTGELKSGVFPSKFSSPSITNYNIAWILILVSTAICIYMWVNAENKYNFFVKDKDDQLIKKWSEVDKSLL